MMRSLSTHTERGKRGRGERTGRGGGDEKSLHLGKLRLQRNEIFLFPLFLLKRSQGHSGDFFEGIFFCEI